MHCHCLTAVWACKGDSHRGVWPWLYAVQWQLLSSAPLWRAVLTCLQSLTCHTPGCTTICFIVPLIPPGTCWEWLCLLGWLQWTLTSHLLRPTNETCCSVEHCTYCSASCQRHMAAIASIDEQWWYIEVCCFWEYLALWIHDDFIKLNVNLILTHTVFNRYPTHIGLGRGPAFSNSMYNFQINLLV